MVGDPTVPVGSYTREVLDRLPAGERETILANVRSEEPEVAGIAAKLTAGAADAGFVYITDVKAAGAEAAQLLRCRAECSPTWPTASPIVKEASNPPEAPPNSTSTGCSTGGGSGALNQAEASCRPRERPAPTGSPRSPSSRWRCSLAFLTIPVIAIFTRLPRQATWSARLGEHDAREALWLSLRTSLAALAIIIVVGTPAAYLLATRNFRRSIRSLLTLIELPLVIPPAVAGIALARRLRSGGHPRRCDQRRRHRAGPADGGRGSSP